MTDRPAFQRLRADELKTPVHYEGAVAGHGDRMRRRLSALQPYVVVCISQEELAALSSIELVFRHPEGLSSRGVEVRKL